jgi:hypothetical protein
VEEEERVAQGTAQEVRDRDSGSAAEAWVEAAAPAAVAVAEELAWAPAVPVGAEAPVRVADCGSLAAEDPEAVAEAVVEVGLGLEALEEDQAAEAGPAEVARAAGPAEDLEGEVGPAAGLDLVGPVVAAVAQVVEAGLDLVGPVVAAVAQVVSEVPVEGAV